jgi:MFS transporter, MHS family, shikimate and dehydroshikimate transport protein
MASTAERLGGERQGDTQSLRQVALASFIGTTIEWYDFFLYGTAAALVFNELFFPEAEPTVGTLAAFGTFAVGFLARPVGGLVFGHYGDRVGRKAMLVISLLIMGLATAAIGILPTYGSIGMAAPIALVLLRMLQGIGVGGEWGGAVLMSVEHAPTGRRGLFGSFPQMGVPAGLLLSTVMFAVMQAATSEAAFLSWGWRVPFLVSIVLVGVGLFIRMKIVESPAFQAVKDDKEESNKPIVDVVKEHPRNVLIAMGMRVGENAVFYIFTVFVLSYAEETLKLGKSTMLTGLAIAAAIGLFTVPLWGWMSDRVGRKPVYLTGAAFSVLFPFAFFALVDTKETVFIYAAMILGINIGHDMMYGPQAAYFSELFGTRVRYSGASIGYQLASVFGGGFAPLIAASLLAANNDSPTLVALYMVGISLITLVATLVAPETYRDEIDESKLEREEREERFTRDPAAQRERPRAQPVGR